MLLIHTREGQNIIIGIDIELNLREINYFNGSSSIKYRMNDSKGELAFGSLVVGDSNLILPQVVMYFTKAVNIAGKKIATLGFEAPRDILIRGEWIGGGSKS